MVKIKYIWIVLFLAGIFISTGCRKEQVPLYEVEAVTVRKPGAAKERVKTTTEFISIAYSDIFGVPIPQNKLSELATTYMSFGDKKLIEDLIVRNFLNSSGSQIPPASEMTSDPEKFVADTYKKLFNREPGEYELGFMTDYIRNHSTLTPQQVYYAFLTSAEYRYY